MKLTVEKSGGIAETIIMELTPEEALVVNHAMRRYAYDLEVDEKNRDMMEKILEVKPWFIELNPSKVGVKS